MVYDLRGGAGSESRLVERTEVQAVSQGFSFAAPTVISLADLVLPNPDPAKVYRAMAMAPLHKDGTQADIMLGIETDDGNGGAFASRANETTLFGAGEIKQCKCVMTEQALPLSAGAELRMRVTAQTNGGGGFIDAPTTLWMALWELEP